MIDFIEYTSEQRKHYVDTSMYYGRYLSKTHDFLLNYKYSMIWQKNGDKEYLAKKKTFKDGKAKRTYLGERSPDTERIYKAFYEEKENSKHGVKTLLETIKKNEAISKILKLNRAPHTIVEIFRRLNELNLDEKIIVIGTNSLYCYEAYCGVFLEQQVLSTSDIDLFSRRNKKISFLFKEVMGDKKIVELIKEIDKTFECDKSVPYQFFNKDNICLEIINPSPRQIKGAYQNNDFFTDVIPLQMDGLQWLENSKLMKTMIVSDKGTVANVTTLHPLDYAIYKNWLGGADDRSPLKKPRDIMQSKLVTQMVDKYMKNIDVEEHLSKAKHFKIEMIDEFRKNIYNRLEMPSSAEGENQTWMERLLT